MNVLKHISRDMKEVVRKLIILLKDGVEIRDVQLGIKVNSCCNCCKKD